ncbi:hypothetical protein NPIL_556071 [Nephila pilipes]|uniref:Uncharacterized protein n=1 Tax=Nephila pilipes TaxID=299642 RepID=A0A8X6QHZ3_NEPPI|nr:hypothetical protein NPIL_556071 [Nephila pilipes]
MRSDDGMTSPSSHAPLRKEKQNSKVGGYWESRSSHAFFFVILFADMRSDDGMTSPSSHAPLRKEKLVMFGLD